MTAVQIADITLGERHRYDLGDIAGLAESMTEVGQLQPVVVTPELALVAGARRLAAARSLGWVEIEAHVVTNLTDAAGLLRAESDENTCRKPFTPTEAESIAAAREALLKPLARERQAEGGRAKASGKLPEANRPRDAAAGGLGYSATTIRKVREVREITESDTTPAPVREAAAQALADMDSTGKVDAAHKAVKATVTAVDYCNRFPELRYYLDLGKHTDVIRLGVALAGYTEPELSMRREALRRSIALAKRQAVQPPEPPPGPDYEALADRMFEAVNRAAKEITRCGGADTLAQVANLDALTVDNWRHQFTHMASTCAALAEALRPTLRSVK